MAIRTIHEGATSVAASDYLYNVERDGEVVEEEIPGLDHVVTSARELRFTLDYPFEEPFEGAVTFARGITLRAIIDAVRAGFRTMYETTSQEDIPGLAGNKRVEGIYGTSFHAIDDIVIERIELCEEDGTLEVIVGS